MIKTVHAFLAVLLAATPAFASPHHYPTHAYDACVGRQAGEIGHITNKHATMEGVCEKVGDRLAITKPRWYHNMEIRPEAYKACQGKKEGAFAQYKNNRKILIKGKCAKDKNGKLYLDSPPLVETKPVAPARDNYSACKGKRLGDESSFTNPFGTTVAGTCVEYGGKLFLKVN